MRCRHIPLYIAMRLGGVSLRCGGTAGQEQSLSVLVGVFVSHLNVFIDTHIKIEHHSVTDITKPL